MAVWGVRGARAGGDHDQTRISCPKRRAAIHPQDVPKSRPSRSLVDTPRIAQLADRARTCLVAFSFTSLYPAIASRSEKLCGAQQGRFPSRSAEVPRRLGAYRWMMAFSCGAFTAPVVPARRPQFHARYSVPKRRGKGAKPCRQPAGDRSSLHLLYTTGRQQTDRAQPAGYCTAAGK